MTKPVFEWDPSYLRPARSALSHSSWITKIERAHAYLSVDWPDEPTETFDLDQFPVVIANRLQQVLHWRRLEEQVAELSDRLQQVEEALGKASGNVAVIQTFAPEPYTLLRPISVTIVNSGSEGLIASFPDANISTEGDNEQEAFENLKSLILDTFDSLDREAFENLGPEPRRQLAVLRSFISVP